MLEGKPRAFFMMLFGALIVLYSTIDSLDGRLTIPTKSNSYVFSFADRPDAFLMMLGVAVAGGLVLCYLGWRSWQK